MRNQMAIVKNVVALQDAYESLRNRDQGVPGMGLVFGFTGAGKTTAIAWLVNRTNGVYVRANATWTPNAMLGAVMTELGSSPLHNGGAAMVNHIVQQLALSSRPLFVDEADYLFSNVKMVETLRDIHDMSGMPVVMVGMEGIERRLVHRLQLARRVSQWVEFQSADLDDTKTLAKTVCEVDIAPDLLEHLHEETKGSVGLMVVGLARIESLAKSNNWKRVDANQWGDRKLFMSRAPKAR